jgi:tRNA(His) 5'-end guanylyltransferase
MGLTVDDFYDLTWEEYSFLDLGHEIRYEKQLDMLRNVISSMFNSSGFAKRTIRPQEVMKLPFIDGATDTVKRKEVPKEFIERALKILRNVN